MQKNKILLVILIVAGVLRFVGTNPGYNQFHADEGISYSAATSMIKNGNLDPLRYDYPALVPLINYFFFKFFFIPGKWTYYYISHLTQIVDGTVHIPIAPLEAKRIFQVFVLGERERNALFWGRYVTALFSLGNVFLTYLLAKEIFNKKVGLIAAFLLTFNYKQVINSHIGLPDIYNAFFVLLSFLTIFKLWKAPNKITYLLSGIVVGLSLSIKYQFFTLFPLALAHFYSSFKDNIFNFKKLFSLRIFIASLAIALMFLIINPYHVLNFERTIEVVRGVSQKYGVGTDKLNLYPLSYFYHIDYGPIEFFLVVSGLIVSLKYYFKKTLLLLSFLIPFCFMFFYYSAGGFYIRNFITITPILFILGALSVTKVFEFLEIRLRRSFVTLGLFAFLGLAVFVPGRNAIINSYSYTRPWGYDIMRPWLEQNLPKEAVVASHPFDASNLGIKNKRTEFDANGAWSLTEHQENGASWALLDLNWAGIPFYFWMSYGIHDLPIYWNKPLPILRNTFFGIATEEMFRYQVHAVTKPWQAPDTHLILLKIPQWPKTEMANIYSVGFDNGQEGWSVHGESYGSGPEFKFDQDVGNIENGSLELIPGAAKFPTARITSVPIPIKEDHLYHIEGYLKTGIKLEPKEREGFIRVDFYQQGYDLEKVGKIASVSSRVYGTDSWVKKEITERAPLGAKFLTVSFQSHISTRTKIWLDDTSVSESKDTVPDITSKDPYDIKDIDLNYLYPNSHGNL